MEGCRSGVSVVVAALNEEIGIGPTLEELQRVLTDSHLVVVDGNSVDRTVEIAKNMGADVSLQEGVGKGDAMFQGIKLLHPSVRYVVFTDADYSYPAEYIPKMVEVLDQDPDVGMVIGDRFNGELDFGKSLTNPFYVGNRLIALAQHVLNGIKLNDPLSGLRVVRAELLKDWKPKGKGVDVVVVGEGRLRFGVVGLGKMGLLHASLLSVFPEVELVAVCEKSALMNRLFKKIFVNTGVHVVNDIEKLRGLDLDAVYVTTPISSHSFIIKNIYSMGIAHNVFTEKTLALNFNQSKALRELDKNSG